VPPDPDDREAPERAEGVPDEARAKSGESNGSARRTLVRRLILVLVVLAALGEIGRRSAPSISREVRLRLAERAIVDGRLDDAGERLDLLISEDPRWTRPRLRRVEVDRRQGRITEAEEALQRAVELGLPVEEGRREFALLRAGRDFPLAEKSLRRVLEEHPDDEEIRRALAEGRAANRR
jgi:predicted Zn-dependent protease